jgi:hypothetical protein
MSRLFCDGPESLERRSGEASAMDEEPIHDESPVSTLHRSFFFLLHGPRPRGEVVRSGGPHRASSNMGNNFYLANRGRCFARGIGGSWVRDWVANGSVLNATTPEAPTFTNSVSDSLHAQHLSPEPELLVSTIDLTCTFAIESPE